MDHRLRKCAEDGDVDALYSVLAQDPDALERLDRMQFVETPLHMAASAGDTRFAMEIATLKPSFAWKLNQLGLSPMHLALQNQHDQVVKGMLRKVDTELVRVKGKGSITPLHYVAQEGNADMLAYFLDVCPLSIEELTADLETAVHVAVKSRSWNAFEVLLGWLRRASKEYILEWQDGNGDTALHIATSTNQLQVMKLLIGNVDVNNQNIVDNWTAMDIFERHKDWLEREVRFILVRVKAKKASELAGSITSRADYLRRDFSRLDRLAEVLGIVGRNKLSPEVRNIVLVVAILIVTATYQAAISPPGGYWQDTDPPAKMTNSSNATNSTPHVAGQMILDNYTFFVFNTIAFGASAFTIVQVTVDVPFFWILNCSILFLCLTYCTALFNTLPSVVATLILMGMCSAGVGIYFVLSWLVSNKL